MWLYGLLVCWVLYRCCWDRWVDWCCCLLVFCGCVWWILYVCCIWSGCFVCIWGLFVNCVDMVCCVVMCVSCWLWSVFCFLGGCCSWLWCFCGVWIVCLCRMVCLYWVVDIVMWCGWCRLVVMVDWLIVNWLLLLILSSVGCCVCCWWLWLNVWGDVLWVVCWCVVDGGWDCLWLDFVRFCCGWLGGLFVGVGCVGG